MTMLKIYLNVSLLLLASNIFAIGVFNNPHCTDYLKKTLARDKEWLTVSAKKEYGLEVQTHIDEFIERALRIDYLGQQAEAINDETNKAFAILRRTLHYADGGKHFSSVEDMQQAFKEIAAKFKQRPSPFFDVIEKEAPPMSAAHIKLFMQMMDSRAQLADRRSALSAHFLDLTFDKPIEKFDQKEIQNLLKKAAVNFKNSLVDRVKAQGMHPDELIRERLYHLVSIENFEVPQTPATIKYYDKVLAYILKSEKVPQIVKDDIQIEKNFLDKYGLTYHAIFKKHLEDVGTYFKISTVPTDGQN